MIKLYLFVCLFILIGCGDNTIISTDKDNIPPIAVAGAQTVVEIGDTIALSDVGSYDPDGTLTLFSWSYDGGETFKNVYVSTTYIIADNPGVHNYILKVQDNDGAVGYDTVVVTVDGPIFVDVEAENNGDGLSWETAFNNLQNGFDALVARGRGELWIASGVYIAPDSGFSFNLPQSTELEGIRILGGFKGDETTSLEVDFDKNRVIISGDIGQDDTDYDRDGYTDFAGRVGNNSAKLLSIKNDNWKMSDDYRLFDLVDSSSSQLVTLQGISFTGASKYALSISGFISLKDVIIKGNFSGIYNVSWALKAYDCEISNADSVALNGRIELYNSKISGNMKITGMYYGVDKPFAYFRGCNIVANRDSSSYFEEADNCYIADNFGNIHIDKIMNSLVANNRGNLNTGNLMNSTISNVDTVHFNAYVNWEPPYLISSIITEVTDIQIGYNTVVNNSLLPFDISDSVECNDCSFEDPMLGVIEKDNVPIPFFSLSPESPAILMGAGDPKAL